ncbi:16S rRNA (guanine(966)-N(2))-methyltransferase RsmD [Mesonia sp. K7]|uniref:16S rRNA (guanine(966)-N(2))-methyltransferase RsmD n=1 Tax=Mesonia sp. K7 TaxID=2218606 RepID=UPI000DA83E3C|nr:16S rRNA (guanine(966)-N(2))-methyltransferase RsmD [Mesonia sp. K7]PZD79230.1 16S rRNA (guanine(966)-N(2))-methyltransferase RsmD [Mesonia sp. K7]
MRIISGKYKGKRLIAPKKLPIRPTTDIAKEGLFNILRNRYYFDEIRVLDLFSGSGNIAYEFASRGVEEITAVDNHVGCLQFINKTAQELEFNIHTIKSDVYRFLEHHSGSYDIIFADPPYDFTDEQFQQIAQLVFESDLLAEEGTLIIEHAKHTQLNTTENFVEDRKYGGSVFSFFQKKA